VRIPNIRAHSCDWQECFVHAQNFRGAFEVVKYRTALEVYSTCTLTAYRIFLQHSNSIPHILILFEGESKWQATSNRVRMSRVRLE